MKPTQHQKSLFRRIKVPALIIPYPESSRKADLDDAEKKKPLFQAKTN